MTGWILSGQNYMVLFLPSLGFMGPALKGWKWVWGHLLSQPSDTLAQRWLPVHTTWWPVGLEEVSVPKGGMLAPRGTTVIPWNWKCRLPPSHFGFLMPLNQQAKKAATGLPEVIDADHQGQVRRPVHKRGMVEYAWNAGDPWRHPSVITCPAIKLNGNSNNQIGQGC